MQNKKRLLNIQRELTEKWLDLLIEMQESGRDLAILEVEDDLTTLRRFKKLTMKHIEDIKEYVRVYIEPIRLGIKDDRETRKQNKNQEDI